MKIANLIGASFLFFVSTLSAQDEPIYLINPSFEGTPAEGTLDNSLPTGWYDCGFPGETIPDIHPVPNGGKFQVTKPPYDGNTYLGMVVRENDTWEMVSQRLSSPLKAGKCYEFSIHLCRSELYVSPSRVSGEYVNYTNPAKLRIWAGNGYCLKTELLAESSVIINTRWLEYNFRFEPKNDYTHIVFEAFYRTPTPFPYNGNILLDNASPIIPVPCDVEKPSVAEIPPSKEDVKDTPTSVKKPTPSPPVISSEPPGVEQPVVQSKKEKILKELDKDKIREGQTIRIDQLYFKADSSSITEESYPVLDEIYEFLVANPKVIVEIGGHTNGIPSPEYCDKLSTERAKAVADYLIKKGIEPERLKYKGYGKRMPIDTNQTAAGRKRNQRVEIKILSLNG